MLDLAFAELCVWHLLAISPIAKHFMAAYPENVGGNPYSFRMASISLRDWQGVRAARINRLVHAHALVGSAYARRPPTLELKHAIILRIASEFQGFCKDLHDEAAEAIAAALAPEDSQQRDLIATACVAGRRLNSGNARPEILKEDFDRLRVGVWQGLAQKYGVLAKDWERRLDLLNQARNCLAHDDASKLSRLQSGGWPITMMTIRDWRKSLDTLAAGMDLVVSEKLALRLHYRPW